MSKKNSKIPGAVRALSEAELRDFRVARGPRSKKIQGKRKDGPSVREWA